MDEFLTSHIEATKYKEMCSLELNYLISNKCNHNSNNYNCDILIKLYNDCIKFKIKKSNKIN